MRKVDEQRLIIAIALIASVLAGNSLIPQNGFWSFFRAGFIISGVTSFIYLVLMGASLKYKDPDDFGPIKYPSYIRRFFYDISVDVYGTFLFLGIAYLTVYLIQSPKPDYSLAIKSNLYYLGLVCSLLVAIFLGFLHRREQKNLKGKNGRSKK